LCHLSRRPLRLADKYQEEVLSDAATDIVSTLLERFSPLELLRVAPMPEVEQLSGLSKDTWRREHPDKIVHLGPRRVGVRVVHALMLSAV
jgi:hypothetical protein